MVNAVNRLPTQGTVLRPNFAAVVAAVAMFVLSAMAYADVAVPPLRAAVTDLTGTLNAAQLAGLDVTLKAFSAKRGSQVAVLLVPSTQPESIEQYSIRVAEAWKIGRKGQDDGVIVVVAKNDRTVRIEVGYGLEGAIPDAIAKRVVEETIVPKFRAGDFNGGLVAGTTTIMKLIEGEKLPPPKARGVQTGQDGRSVTDGIIFLLVALAAVGSIVRALLGRTIAALAGGGIVGLIAWLFFGSLVIAGLAGIAGVLFSLITGASTVGRRGIGGGFGRGGGFGGGGGGFGGGGGGFGGGGASGRW